MKKIKVLIVDDSAIVRKVLTEIFGSEPDIEVVGTAPDAYVARAKILALRPDVITLDIEMPRMNGLEFLKKLMAFQPMPVVVISSLGQAGSDAALEAIQLGAVDALPNPGGPYSVGDLRRELPHRIRAAAHARVKGLAPKAIGTMVIPSPADLRPDALIVIGASTGGTEAIAWILRQLPAQTPPILVAQHIPSGFSKCFAERLDRSSAIRVCEATNSMEIRTGMAIVAPGNRHMLMKRVGGKRVVELSDGPPVNYHRPSVDLLFRSVTAEGSRITAILLTGMGSDGAEGLLELRQAGALTMAQDEPSCVVFGMPQAALRLGAVDQTTPLAMIPSRLMRAVRSPPLLPAY